MIDHAMMQLCQSSLQPVGKKSIAPFRQPEPLSLAWPSIVSISLRHAAKRDDFPEPIWPTTATNSPG